MNINDIDLMASYWTIAGNTFPGDGSEISPFTLQERAEVAGRVGWRGMGLVHADIAATIQQVGIQTVRQIFADNGIRHVELEFLVDWHLQGTQRLASDTMFSDMLDIASKIEIKKIKLGGGVFEEGEPDLPAMRDAIARLGERAAPLGIDLVVEFLPFASINSIKTGVALTENLGVDNVGVLVDTWHVHRGGMQADEIRTIPPQLLKAVELDDAGAEVMDNFFNDSTHYRRLCGEGVIDIAGQIQAIVDTGYTGYWGVELISAEHRKLPLEEAARRAFDTTMAQFETIHFPETAGVA
jgi:sugar phosphate isomerase/epimerase